MKKAHSRARERLLLKKRIEQIWWYLFICHTKSAPRSDIFQRRDSTVIAVKKATLYLKARGVDLDPAEQNSSRELFTK